MAAANSRNRSVDGLEGLVAFIGGRHSGLFRWLFGDHTGPAAYLVPLVIIVVAVAVIAALESVKRRG